MLDLPIWTLATETDWTAATKSTAKHKMSAFIFILNEMDDLYISTNKQVLIES